MIPTLFKNGVNDWKIRNPSWKWKIGIIFFVAFVGNLMAGATGYGVYLLIPLNFIIFIIAMVWAIIEAWKSRSNSNFWHFILGILISFLILGILYILFMLLTSSDWGNAFVNKLL